MRGSVMKKQSNLPLEKATKLVCDHWFPFDINLLTEIIDSINTIDGEEDISFDHCLDKLKSDASLYLLVLKELFYDLKQVYISSEISSFDILSSATIGDLRRALSKVCLFQTHHRLSDASKVQSKRLSEMLISSTAAVELSKTSDLSVILTYSAAVIRQLGYTLIAWNYPRIYEKILENPLSQVDIDREVRKYLGFSPSMLALAVINKFGFDEDFSKIILGNAQSKSDDKNQYHAINKICEVGEALSRSSNPELYTTAEKDFKFAETQICSFLGEDAVRKILEKASDKKEVDSKQMNLSFLEDPQTLIQKTIFSRSLKLKNNYIEVLPENLYNEVVDLYSSMEPDGNQKEYVTKYVKEIIPKTFFSSLRVFLIDPIEEMLFSSLAIGNSKTLNFKNLSLKTGNQDSICHLALGLSSPMRQTLILPNNETVNVIASSFGEPKLGVFIVEFFDSEDVKEEIAYFKALKNVFCDCLNI
jgi:hypothetical protein